MSLFITGTDTDVGKTWVAAAMVRAWRETGLDVVGMKPIACGSRDDAELLQAAAGGAIQIDRVNPVWLHPAAAPYTAALIEERVVDLSLIRDSFTHLKARHSAVLVEGAGGWLVPILRDYSISDLAAEFDLPVVIVAANRLGVLNHTLLTAESILTRGLTCAGVVLNQPQAIRHDDAACITNAGILEDLLRSRGIPYLGEVEHGSYNLPERLLDLRRRFNGN